MRRIKANVASLAIVGVVVVMLVNGTAAQPGSPAVEASQANLEAATEWLIGQHGEDGGFPGFDGVSDPSTTTDAIVALASAESRGVDTGSSLEDAVAFLESDDVAREYAGTGAGQAAKLVLAIVASGGDPRDFASFDPLGLVESGVDENSGMYGTGIYDHALAMLALAAAEREIPAEALTTLEDSQSPEGGWAFDGSAAEGAADSNTTALVVQALVASGEGDSSLIADGMAYLQTTLVDGTGATFQPESDFPADSTSTALVMQAVTAAGDDPSSEVWGNLPAALGAFQTESGAFYYNADDTADNIFNTVQAIPAVAGLALPIAPAAQVGTPAAVRLDFMIVEAA